jgi:transcriptional repressor NrdR
MVCPFCLHKKTEIFNSRRTKKLNSTWRRRRCLACKKEFTTREYIDAEKLFKVTSASGKPLPYQKSTLLLSLLQACDHLPNHDDVFWLCETIEQKLIALAATSEQLVTTDIIIAEALKVLKRFDTPAFVKYLSYHRTNLDIRDIKRQLR